MLMIWKNMKASGFLKRRPSCFSLLQAAAPGGGQVSSVWAAPETAVCSLILPVQEGLTWKCLGVSTPSPRFFFFSLVVTKEFSFRGLSRFRFCYISVPICQLPSCCKMPGYLATCATSLVVCFLLKDTVAHFCI